MRTRKTTRTTTKFGFSKLALACASFLAFAGLAAALVERQPVNDGRAVSEGETPQEIATEDGKVLVPVDGPVTRSRGS